MNEKYLVFDIETTGLRATEGSKITCICAKDSNENIFMEVGENEKEIIEKFIGFVKEKDVEVFVTANGRDFDISFLLLRAYANQIELEKVSFLFCLKNIHFDIINDVTSSRISLDNLARLFGFDVKTGNGFKAIQLFEMKRYDELVHYCINDVLLTEKIYLQLTKSKRDENGTK